LTYTTSEIAAARDWLIEYRDGLMDSWPETMTETVTITHVIAMLHGLLAAKQEKS
jgi:hypothetical protein